MILKLLYFFLIICHAEDGPFPRQEVQVIKNLNRINFPKEIYIKSYPDIDSKWMEKFGIPFSMELGKFFEIGHLPINLNFVGFYKVPLIFEGGEYVWRAQLIIPLPD